MTDNVMKQVLLEELLNTYHRYLVINPNNYEKAVALSNKMKRLRNKLKEFDTILSREDKAFIVRTKGDISGDTQ